MTRLDPLMGAGLLLVLPPLLSGIINKTKALFAGRAGPPLLQGYWDLLRLVRKESVTSATTTWVFVAGPALTLAAVALAGLLVPVGPGSALCPFPGDFVLFAYLLGFGRFFTTSAALDTGSAFEGMGAARDVTFAGFAEVTLFLGFLTLAALTHELSLSDMLSADVPGATAPAVLVAGGLFVVLLAENARVPVDDPNTHLELTMVHEVMVLDHSGPALAAILYGAGVKLLVLGSLLARVVLALLGPSAGWAAFLAVLAALMIGVGVVESALARLRLTHVPALLVGACTLAGFGFLLAVTA